MTVLTMAFLGIDNRRDLPKVSYSTALDYYVGICFAFVLASILQFAGVHFFTKHGSGEWMPEVTADMPQGNEAEPEVLNVEKQVSEVFKRCLHRKSVFASLNPTLASPPPLTHKDSIFMGSLRDREVVCAASDARVRLLNPVFEGQCHLIHLTIFRRFSWPIFSLYVHQKVT